MVPKTRMAMLIAVLGLGSGSAWSGEADVVDVTATRAADGTWRFDVTVAHDDEGWEHYADRWDIVAPDGTVLATRTLLHPHVTEQPFTRSLSGVTIDPDISEVTVRAHDSVHMLGGDEKRVPLSVQ
ncbi:MAG: hypothetical protein ACTS3R_10210 [Inquilinaceae bacterium]